MKSFKCFTLHVSESQKINRTTKVPLDFKLQIGMQLSIGNYFYFLKICLIAFCLQIDNFNYIFLVSFCFFFFSFASLPPPLTKPKSLLVSDSNHVCMIDIQYSNTYLYVCVVRYVRLTCIILIYICLCRAICMINIHYSNTDMFVSCDM